MYIGALIHVHFGVQHLKLRLNLTLNTQVICHNCKHRNDPKIEMSGSLYPNDVTILIAVYFHWF